MGGFCEKWTFPPHRVHYVQYQYLLFYILLISGVRTHPTHPPAYRPWIASSTCNVQLACRSTRSIAAARARARTAASVSGVIRGGSTQTCIS